MVTLAKKKANADNFEQLFSQYESILMLETTNINNRLLHNLKKEVCTQISGKFLHGKKKTFSKRCSEKQNEMLAKCIKGNVILFFTNDSCLKFYEIISNYNRKGTAKYNQPALLDYHIEAQLTKLPPEKTKVFQKLRVPTKLTKGCIEITAGFQVLEKGKNVTQMQIDILSAMGIMPYNYKPSLKAVYSHGEIADASIFDLKSSYFSEVLKTSLDQNHLISHGIDYAANPTVTDNCLSQLYRDCFAINLVFSGEKSDFEVPQEFKESIALMNDPEALAKAAAAAAASNVNSSNANNNNEGANDNDKKEEAAKVEESESEEAESVDFDF